jgi:hypothetical protein
MTWHMRRSGLRSADGVRAVFMRRGMRSGKWLGCTAHSPIGDGRGLTMPEYRFYNLEHKP